jgi:hypothetical protein
MPSSNESSTVANDVSEAELLWRDYALNADLYKFYMDITIKVNVFFYAATGAILSFSLSQAGIAYAKWAISLPVLMSIGLAVVFGRAVPWAIALRHDTVLIAKRLRLQNSNEFSPLVFVLVVVCILTTFTAVGLLLIVCLI